MNKIQLFGLKNANLKYINNYRLVDTKRLQK